MLQQYAPSKKPDECVILGSRDNKDVDADDVDEEAEQAEEDEEEDVQAAVLATRAKRPATSKTRTVRKKNRMCRGSGVKVTYMLDGQISPLCQRAMLELQIQSTFLSISSTMTCANIWQMSTKYARIDKGVHNIQITVADIRCFIGILLLSGYASVPRWRML